MRIKLDENVTVTARHVLHQFGHDVHSVHDEELADATDVELLRVCRAEGRMLVTFVSASVIFVPIGRAAIPVSCCSALSISSQKRC